SLHELIAKAFIVEKEYFPETVYAFRHPLTQEVTYDSLLKDRRLRGHADTARAYEQLGRVRGDEYASLIAHHYDRAGEALEAVQWYQRAARWAQRRDPSETVRLWKRVCTLLDGVPDAPKSPILGLRARSEILAVGGWRTGLSEAEAARLFEEGQALSVRCGDALAHARLLEAYGGARGFAGDIEALVEYVGQASKATQDEADLGRRAARYRRLMFANLHLGNLKEALALTDQVQELLPGAPEGGPDAPNPFASLELGPVAFRGLVLAGMGRAEEAEQYLSRAGRLALSPGFTEMVPVLPVLYLFSTMIAWYKGDVSAADAHSAALAEYASQSHSTWDAVIAHMCQGQAQILSGRATAAARTFEAGLRLARERRVGLEGEADLLSFQAEAYLDAGDEWRGLATAAEAVRVARERKTRWWEVRAQRAYARALLLKEGRARADEADEALQHALFLVMETGARAEEPFLRMTLAELARVRGDEAGRERELSEARRLFAASGATARAAPLAAAV
ncbi:MAG: hypothetical protein O7F10_13785, partial [Deltaproteobacteria bacterium]|nr:hypothetical protein [Deltaproteobacteria bacterium]